jgi:ketosteroid isomerase-like protein
VRTIRTAVAAAALVAALAGCGTPVAGTPAPQPSPPPDPVADQRAVEDVFHQYYEALRVRDFARACSFNAPETTDQLLANLRSRGVEAATCEEALTAVYAVPGAAQVVDQIVSTATVDGVTVTGDTATVTWSSEFGGTRNTVSSELRREGDRWLLVDVGT